VTRWLLCCAALATAAGCNSGDDVESRTSVRLLPAEAPAEDAEAVVIRSTRHLLDLLSGDDTVGAGAYLHPNFSWYRIPEPSHNLVTGPRIPRDPDYLDRRVRAVPLIERVSQPAFRVEQRRDSVAVVGVREECDSCEPHSVTVSWRLTRDGWRVYSLYTRRAEHRHRMQTEDG
jgi:hypothetical protein